MAKKYSTDPSAAQNGGNLGVFGPGDMIAAFPTGTGAEAGRDLAAGRDELRLSHHPALAVRGSEEGFRRAVPASAVRIADSTYMAQLATSANVQVKDNAPAAIKEAVKDQPKHRKDKTVLATYKGGRDRS